MESAVAESTEGFAKVDGATALAVSTIDSQSGRAEDFMPCRTPYNTRYSQS